MLEQLVIKDWKELYFFTEEMQFFSNFGHQQLNIFMVPDLAFLTRGDTLISIVKEIDISYG